MEFLTQNLNDKKGLNDQKFDAEQVRERQRDMPKNVVFRYVIELDRCDPTTTNRIDCMERCTTNRKFILVKLDRRTLNVWD